jgi:hypothetical protein
MIRRPRQFRDPDQASTTLPSSDIGRLDPPRVTPHRPVRRWEERQHEGLANQNALLNAWQQMAESLGGLLVLTRANAPGDAIGTGTLTINANGANERKFPANFQSVAITNFSGSNMTVAAAPAQSQAPSVGAGVYVIPGGTYRIIPIRGAVVTVYGTPGSVYDLTTYSKPRPMDFAGLGGSAPLGGVLVPALTTTSQTVNLTGQSLARLVVVQSVTAVAGGSLQVTINAVTPSGYVYPLLVGLAVTAVSVVPLRIGPALTPSPNAVANDVVPAALQIVATTTPAITYGLDFVAGR